MWACQYSQGFSLAPLIIDMLIGIAKVGITFSVYIWVGSDLNIAATAECRSIKRKTIHCSLTTVRTHSLKLLFIFVNQRKNKRFRINNRFIRWTPCLLHESPKNVPMLWFDHCQRIRNSITFSMKRVRTKSITRCSIFQLPFFGQRKTTKGLDR